MPGTIRGDRRPFGDMLCAQRGFLKLERIILRETNGSRRAVWASFLLPGTWSAAGKILTVHPREALRFWESQCFLQTEPRSHFLKVTQVEKREEKKVQVETGKNELEDWRDLSEGESCQAEETQVERSVDGDFNNSEVRIEFYGQQQVEF